MYEADKIDPIEYFSNPKESAQKRYEALRAYFLESLTQKEAAEISGYSASTFQSLVSNFKNGKIEFFVKPQHGPNQRQTSDFIQERIISLRKSNHSIYDIRDILSEEGFHTSIQTINRITNDEGFAKLPRRTKEELGLTKKNTLLPQISTAIDIEQLESHKFECQVGGIYYFIPYILQTELYELISSIPFPETSKLSKINSIFSILALKLMGHERLSKISSYNHDAGFGFFAGLNVPPKTTATSTYSYMVDKESIQSFMKEFISRMSSTYPQYYQGDTINLDFHSIPHYGEKSEMDDNWVGARHQRI
jgi:transposase